MTIAPDAICLDDAVNRISYRDAGEAIGRIAHHIRAGGLAREERCAVFSKNDAMAVLCLLAVQWAGATYVPVNASHSLEDAATTLDACEVTTLFYSQVFASEARALAERCASVRRIVCIDAAAEPGPSVPQWCADTQSQAEPFRYAPEDVVGLYATGGTTGVPKAVMLTSLNFDIAAANFHAAVRSDAQSVFLAATPITHAAGTFATMLMASGARTVVLPRFDAKAVLDAIERERVTHLYLPPTAIYMLLDEPGVRERDFSSIQYFIYTSAPMSTARLMEAMDVFGPVMIQFWGQTEAPNFCTCLSREDHVAFVRSGDARIASCGLPMLLTPVAVMDDHGELIGDGGMGELVVSGPLVMGGYYRNEAATDEAGAFGWHHTGDVGRIDADGYVFILDRKKDMIISGGYNIYPREVEEVLLGHAGVSECAVVGAPDEKWGEAVTAVVRLRASASASESDLIAHVRQSLGSIKTPKRLMIWDDLPRTAVGKIDKKAIRQSFWIGQSRNI